MEKQESARLIREILAHHTLFSACAPSLLNTAAEACSLREFPLGAELKSYDDKPFLCIIHSGSAHVFTKDQSSDLLLRILRAGDTFGVATLFGNTGESAVTKIIAVEATQSVCMSEETVRQLMINDSALAMRYIDFLADRIRFLNKRIACIGAGSAEDKLCTWIYHQLPPTEEACTYVLPMSLSRLADTLGLGRASLYRALDELEAHGVIKRDGKTLHIPCRSALKAFGKTEHHER